jgi:NADPH:quinone reductase
MTGLAKVIQLARRPEGAVAAADFALVETPLPEPAAGEVLVRNSWMSLDPYMRLPLTGRHGVHAAMAVGEVMTGAAVGLVERSRADGLPEGSLVLSQKGWRDRFVARAETLQRLPDEANPQWRMGVLGLTGLTAWVGVEEVLQPKAGETLFVSGAAGAVGSVACQLAKRRGARVLASAGSPEKVAWLTGELGVDAAVDYRLQDIGTFLAAQCPAGLDAYFDNVGGETLDRAILAMRQRGRIGLCGAVAQYEGGDYRAGPAEFFAIIEKGLTVTGFNAGLWSPRAGEITERLRSLVEAGEIVWRETIVEGLENAPAAFAALFAGGNLGKLLVRLS